MMVLAQPLVEACDWCVLRHEASDEHEGSGQDALVEELCSRLNRRTR